MERTATFKFEGGDTAWEEKNLGSYANSEVRFVEVQEKLCSEVVEGKDQCYQLIEEYEEVVTGPLLMNLFQYLVFSRLWKPGGKTSRKKNQI